MKKKIAILGCAWSTYFVKEFLEGVQQAVNEDQTDVYFFNGYNYTEYSGYLNYTGYSIYDLIDYKDYNGIIVLSDLINNERILERERQRIIQSGTPAITINKKLQGISCITIDNYSGSHEVITHLIKEHGIKDIGYVCGKEQSNDFSERYCAYSDVLKENGISFQQDKVFTIEKSDYHYSYNFFDEYIKSKKKLPEAVVCANDLIALGLIKVCSENNIKIPEEVKIIGYDDIFYSKSIIPSLSTVKSNAFEIGIEAVKKILATKHDNLIVKMKSTPVYRRSCGCNVEEDNKYKILPLDILSSSADTKEFQTQLDVIQEIFTDAKDVFTLLTNLEKFFNSSHHFEGSDFCIFLKADWSSVLINSVENLPQNWSYGDRVQSIVSIQNNQKYAREVIDSQKIVPERMISDKNDLFIVMPIYNHLYVHGYFVSKNNLLILENNYGYNWIKNLGTSIERFRKKNMYKQMSLQYLKLSTRDALSGCLNRVGLDKLAVPFYEQNKKNGYSTILFFVDINSMKTINDQYGHLHGDLAVKTVADSILETVPRNWLSIRYGGDEFLILGNSNNYKDENYSVLIQQRLVQKTSVMHLPYNLTASVGNLTVPPDSQLTLVQAVEKVDSIMYLNKQKYHNSH